MQYCNYYCLTKMWYLVIIYFYNGYFIENNNFNIFILLIFLMSIFSSYIPISILCGVQNNKYCSSKHIHLPQNIIIIKYIINIYYLFKSFDTHTANFYVAPEQHWSLTQCYMQFYSFQKYSNLYIIIILTRSSTL